MKTQDRIGTVSALAVKAMAILALAVGQVQAAMMTVEVPNGKFQLYKPGTGYTVAATFAPGNNYAKGVGDNLTVLGGGVAEYGDGTTGGVVDCPGWAGPVEGTTPGDLWSTGFEEDGTTCFNAFGTWSGGNGTMIELVPLGNSVPSAIYTLSAMIDGSAGPVILDLLVDGEAVTPTTSVDPIGPGDPTSGWEEISRTYEDVPSGELKIRVGTPALGGDLYGTRTRIDNVALTLEITDLNIPDVDAGVDMITWSGQAVQLDPNVVNRDVTPLTFAWTADPADGVVFDPGAEVEAPTVTITKSTVVSTLVPVANAGFESPVLTDGTEESNPPGWTDGYYDLANPTVWVVGEALAGVYNPDATIGYGGVVPEGENVAYTTASSSRDRGLSQVLSTSLEANTRYELSVLVGNPYLFNRSTATADYRIELLAGGVLLALDTGPSPINDQTWKTAMVVYDSGEEPAQLGEPLEIRLIAVNYTDGKGVDFDDVKLTAEGAIPAAYAVKLTLAVNNEGSTRPDVKDALVIDVYDDACLAAKASGLGPDKPGDLDGNCITDANDLNILAEKWLNDTALAGSIPKP